jgi:transketolase N-terminal domain/subunit
MKNLELKNRIIEISYNHKLSHLSSCLTAVDIIDEIYRIKKANEKFVLSEGHAGLALYCVIEKHLGINAEKIFKHHGIHPDHCKECNLDCSSGSLGHGLGIAIGMAIADKTKNVYCLVSDGECSEGSIYESLNFIDKYKVDNLKIYFNLNGFGAYSKIDVYKMQFKLFSLHASGNMNFRYTTVSEFNFLKNDLSDHYKILINTEYNAWKLYLQQHKDIN